MKRFCREPVVRLVPLAAMLLIILIDRELLGRKSLLVHGLADETAHLLTGIAMILVLMRFLPAIRFLPAMAGAVAIDIDHAPDVLGLLDPSGPSSRFVTHSFATVTVLLLIALLDRKRARGWISAALGVSIHLFRDAATGNVIAAWPLSHAPISIPYAAYAGVLACLSLVFIIVSQPRPTIGEITSPGSPAGLLGHWND